jgi:hypothetical protein
MNKLYGTLLAVALLGFVSSADARRRCGSCEPRVATCTKRCEPCAIKPSPCNPPKVTEKRWIVQEPCRKMICVEGVCDHEVVQRCTTTESKKCVSGCRVNCAGAVNPEDRDSSGSQANQAGSEEEAEEQIIS